MAAVSGDAANMDQATFTEFQSCMKLYIDILSSNRLRWTVKKQVQIIRRDS